MSASISASTENIDHTIRLSKMGSRCSSKVPPKGQRAFRPSSFTMIQLYLLLMWPISILYLFGVYNFMTSAKTRETSLRNVGGLLYILDLVEDKDIHHPAVAALRLRLSRDPSEEVEPNPPLTEPRDFFIRYKKPTAHCRKLVNIGGQGCLRRYEGNKDVCLDPEVIPPRGTCLAYSFGVADDITFEDSLVNLRNCLVHLYDPTILQQGWFLEPPHPKRVFHTEALAAEHKEGPSSVSSHTVLQTLDALLERNGHRNATLHYLKLDIEGGEWKVLRHLVENGLLDNVVQLALELHSMDLRDMPSDRWLGVLQERYDVLHSLEEVGFRRVRVVDNEHYLCRVDFRGPQDQPEKGAKSTNGNSTEGLSLRAGNDLAQNNYSTAIEKVGHKLNSAPENWNTGSGANIFDGETSRSKIQKSQNRDSGSSFSHLPSVDDNLKRNNGINRPGDDLTADVKNKLILSVITSGGDTVGNIKDQAVTSPVNTVADPSGDVKVPFLQPTTEHGDVQSADISGHLSHFASLLKRVPSGVAIEAGVVFDTEEEWLEFERHYQQVCQEVLYVRVHKPNNNKGR